MWILIQALWFGLAAMTIFVDRSLLSKPYDPEHPEDFDLKDRSATPFLLLMLLLGSLVVPVYLWYSRRTAVAVMAGVGLVILYAGFIALLTSAMR